MNLLASSLVRDYNVLSAGSGKEAFQVSRNYKPAIHLLLSNFEMPEMNGIVLARQISLERPQIKVLLMSGITGGTLILNEGWHFLPKPFIASQMNALVAGLINPERDPATEHDPDLIETMVSHSAFGDGECRGRLSGVIARSGADIVCNECGAVVRRVPAHQIEWALAQMQFTCDASEAQRFVPPV